MKKVDLNVDIGEGFEFDAQLLDFATSANVCCGEHAGSWELTIATVHLCRSKGVRIGAHPGFPDRESMGRRMPTFEQFLDYLPNLQMQMMRFRIEFGAPDYVKPHGAWYNMLCSPDDEGRVQISVRILEAEVVASRCAVMLLPSSAFISRLQSRGVNVLSEGFADRAYSKTGGLLSRTEPKAVLTDESEIRSQVLTLAPVVDSICLHGDTPGCWEIAKLVRSTLEEAGYEVRY